MDHGPADPAIRKKRLLPKAEKSRELGDVIGPGGLEPGAPQRLLNWKLDWREYFRRFCAAHGGNPVEIGGKLVLPDGWSYSCTDYRGPEWPPPADPYERRALLASYWAERAGIVRDELKHLTITRKGLVELLVSRDQPVVKKVSRREMVDGVSQLHVDREELSVEPFDMRIKWLQEDLVFCEAKVIEHGGKS